MTEELTSSEEFFVLGIILGTLSSRSKRDRFSFLSAEASIVALSPVSKIALPYLLYILEKEDHVYVDILDVVERVLCPFLIFHLKKDEALPSEEKIVAHLEHSVSHLKDKELRL